MGRRHMASGYCKADEQWLITKLLLRIYVLEDVRKLFIRPRAHTADVHTVKTVKQMRRLYKSGSCFPMYFFRSESQGCLALC